MYDFYFGLHVDLSKTVVYVADMLRFCHRHGNFFIFVEFGNFFRKNFFRAIIGNFFIRAEFFLPVNSVRASGLLLYVLALSLARVADVALSHELERKFKFHSIELGNFPDDFNFFGDIFFAPTRV